MNGPFFKQAVPWHDLFEPDTVGDGPQALAYTDDGVPMRFAHVQYGTRRPDIGFTVRIAGVSVDVAALWAAKGTAVYVNTNAIPANVRREAEGSPPSVTAVASITFLRNGFVEFLPEDYPPAAYVLNGSATVGDQYRIRFRLLDRSTLGVLSGTFDQYLTIDQPRQLMMTYVRTTSGSFTAWAEVAIDLQRVSDGALLHTYTARIEASAAIT